MPAASIRSTAERSRETDLVRTSGARRSKNSISWPLINFETVPVFSTLTIRESIGLRIAFVIKNSLGNLVFRALRAVKVATPCAYQIALRRPKGSGGIMLQSQEIQELLKVQPRSPLCD